MKKKVLKYVGIGLRCLILLPLLSLIIGSYIGIRIYKNSPDKKRGFGLASLTVIVSLFLTGALVQAFPSSSKPTPTPTPQVQVTKAPTAIPENKKVDEPTPTTYTDGERVDAKVVRVVDGDTMDFSIDGKTERIRIIGINTPETVDPRKSVECFGQEASQMAKQLLTPGMKVILEADVTQDNRDKYNRLLRYVWWPEDVTEDYGEKMIRLGFAYEYTYEVPYKYQALYKQAQEDAEAGKKGLWADNACVTTPRPTTKLVVNPTNPPSAGGGACKYSCTSPDRDCSDFSTHAEAVAFFNCCGFMATNDPMKLDSVGVGDGVPCELLP